MHIDIHNFKRILDQVMFYLIVKRSVSRKTRSVINLQQDRFSLVIKHYIESQ